MTDILWSKVQWKSFGKGGSNVMVDPSLLYALGSESDDFSRNICVVYGICGLPCENLGLSGENFRDVPCDEK